MYLELNQSIINDSKIKAFHLSPRRLVLQRLSILDIGYLRSPKSTLLII